MSENEFLKRLNEECKKKGVKTNFQSIEHLSDYIVSAEGLISSFRDD